MKTLHSRRNFISNLAVAGTALATAPALLAQSGAPYKIIAFSKPFQTLSASDTADFVAEVGWDGIECPVRAKGQILPERVEDELPKMVEAMKKRGKEVTIITTDVKNLKDPLTEKVLRTASKLGIKRYRLGFWKYDAKKPVADTLKEAGAELRDLAALNKELGICAGFQNHSGADYVGAPIWDIYSMIKDLDPKHMGICFDIGHANIEGGLSWPIESRLMEPFYTAVFVKDFAWKKGDKGWKAEWCPLGEGQVNPKFFQTLKKSSYKGPICQHHEYPLKPGKEMLEPMKKDLAVLKQWLA
jgi:sugar phosphate isomerase/epimerase